MPQLAIPLFSLALQYEKSVRGGEWRVVPEQQCIPRRRTNDRQETLCRISRMGHK